MFNKKRIGLTFLGVSAAIGLVLTQTAGSPRQYQLGGTFIGNNGAGNIWNALQAPIDPAGRTAALRVNIAVYEATTAGLLSAFGADTLGEFAGEIRMISRNTAKYATVAQANLQGNPPQRQAILTMNGTIEFVGQDELIVNYAVDVYPASTDADLDGYPDVGAVPVVSFTSVDHARRVPIP